jgi:hypothetical protein
MNISSDCLFLHFGFSNLFPLCIGSFFPAFVVIYFGEIVHPNNLKQVVSEFQSCQIAGFGT